MKGEIMGRTQTAETEDQDTTSAKTAIDQPYAIVRAMVIDAIALYRRLTGRPPALMYLTPALEAALEIDFGRSFNQHGHLRTMYPNQLFDCKPIWDQKEFRLE